ncbi:MAG: glycosyltransferase [Paracoccaceae bacterium]|nr:glycosyltransferase [Paracoccaceae bacterium]
MNILMFTNTFAPHVGGVARSVALLAEALRARGHAVLVVAPAFPGHADDTPGVLRFPALREVAGTEFSLPIPLSRIIRDEIDAFAPDIVHSHHPFLLGDTALRIAAERGIPIIDTHHTRYDLYVQRFVRAEERMARLMWRLSVGYCNLCDAVIAPSASIAALLSENGVEVPIHVVPTGIPIEAFEGGSREAGRLRLCLPQEAFVAGHLGRLAAEKNLGFLAEALAGFLASHPEARAAIAGQGPMRDEIAARFAEAGVGERLHWTGILRGPELADFYAALDVFAFASTTETQGIVLAEAMAAGRTVVALDAPGTREAVVDGETGLLLPQGASAADFAAALGRIAALDTPARAMMEKAARRRVQGYSVEAMAEGVLALYQDLTARRAAARPRDATEWRRAWRRLVQESNILGKFLHALGDAVRPEADAG